MVATRRPLSTARSPEIISFSSTNVTVGAASRALITNLSLTIKEGERWAILGANGSGKSTLAHLMSQTLAAAHEDSCACQIISFDAHQKLLQAESKQFLESKFDATNMRATAASYLNPDLYPIDPADERISSKRTRLTTLPLRYDIGKDSPDLAELEAAVSGSSAAATLLKQLGLYDQRHSPVHGLSTGEGRKMMLIKSLLKPPRLLVLDEAFDGLDVASRAALAGVLETSYTSALALIAHRPADLLLQPTHALLLGQGPDGLGYTAGAWETMQQTVHTFFEAQHAEKRAKDATVAARAAGKTKRVLSPNATPEEAADWAAGRASAQRDASEAAAPPLVELKNICVSYPMKTVFEGLSWTVRKGEKWVVAGGNGSGKSTLLELITADNQHGYTNDVRLFGRSKNGEGLSIWEIKEKLGVVSTKFHMSYVDYAGPGAGRELSTWDVVCSGFYDSIGLYKKVGIDQEKVARAWVHRFGLTDLVTPPALGVRRVDRLTGKVVYDRPALKAAPQYFHTLSFGEQKLVLLCRAMVKQPPLLLLDEPTHGLSGESRDRLLGMLSGLVDDPAVTIVYVSHHQDEIDSLAFENVLQLGSTGVGTDLGSGARDRGGAKS